MKGILIIMSALLAMTTAATCDEVVLNETLNTIPAGKADSGVAVVNGRLKGTKALSLDDKATMKWDLPAVKDDFFMELWIKPENWDATTTGEAQVLSFKLGDAVYRLRKPQGRASLILEKNGAAIQSYPIYSWKQAPWMATRVKKGKEDVTWHYLNVARSDNHLLLSIDAFPAFVDQDAEATGGLTFVQLGGQEKTAFADLRVIAAKPPAGSALRARFRSLYRGLPDLLQSTVTCPFTETPPKLDGAMDEAEWARAATLVGFTQLARRGGQFGHLCPEKIEGRICYDDRYLYLALKTPFEGTLRARKHGRFDQPLWNEESWEMFFHPPYTGVPDFCQLIGNTFGDQADLKMLNLAWNGKWDWKTAVKDGAWTAELRADFQGIDTPPPGDFAVWTMNLLNTFASAGWRPTQRYNDSASFGVLRFDKNAPVVQPDNFDVTTDSISVPVKILGKGKKRSLRLALRVYAPGDALPTIEDAKTLTIDDGVEAARDLTVSIKGIPEGQAALIVQDGDDALFFQSFKFPVAAKKIRAPFPSNKEKPETKAIAKEKNDDQPLTEEQKAYRRKWTAKQLGETLLESSEWMGNKLGIGDDVPKPWTPMNVEGQTIECWRRKYVYDDSLMPAQIVSKGENLLASPIEFVMTADGKRLDVSKAKVSVDKINDSLVKVTCVARSGPFQLETRTDYEFDGMGKVTLTLSCPDDVSVVDGLRLIVPLRDDHAKLYHVVDSASGHAPNSDSEQIPTDGLRLNAFRESVWLGDETRGLCWFAENMKNWGLRDENDIQVVSPEKAGRRDFVVKMIEKPIKLERPWSVVFGLQATPNKPLPADFRERADRSAINWNWFWGEGPYYPFQSTFAEPARNHVERARKHGLEVMPCSSVLFYGKYHTQNARFGENPNGDLEHRELMIWGPLWRQSANVQPPSPTIPEKHTGPGKWYDKKNQPSDLTHLCAASPWQDYYLWRLNQTIEDTDLGSIYLDQPIYQCANSHHGCGYVDYKGQWAATTPIFAMRDMLKRIYRLFQNKHGETLIKWHSSNQLVPPILSFVDVFWDGENYGSGPHKVFEFYSETMTPGRMRAQHDTRKFGVAADLLPEYEGRYAPSVASERDMMGVMMVHDSNCWPAHVAHPAVVKAIQDLKLSYSLKDMKTVYYWDDNPAVSIQPEKDVVFILFHKNDLALLVVFNWSNKPVNAKIKLDLRKLGLDPGTAKVKDAETEMVVADDGADFQVPILPRDFRMLEIGTNADRNE